MSLRLKVTEADYARRALREAFKRDFSIARRDMRPGALAAQFKSRKRGQIDRLTGQAIATAQRNRKPMALGGIAALAAALITYSARRWNRRQIAKDRAVLETLNKNLNGDQL